MSKSFSEIFTGFPKNKKVAIWTHSTPDPDAISSSIGLQWLLKKKFEINSDIFYSGEISHPQNKTMMNVLSINLKNREDIKSTSFNKSYIKNIIVDGSEKNVGVKDLKINGIIDHHRVDIDESKYDFCLIEQVGACTSLIYDLIKKEDINFENNDEDKDVASGMLLGIKIDTNDLLSENISELDFKAYKELLPFADLQKISSILNYPLPQYLFELEGEILKSKNIEKIHATYISFIGILSASKRDALPVLADKILRMEGITTSIVFSIIDDNIEASIRSRDVSLDVNSFCQKVFGKEYSGAKYGSGGAKVPLGFLDVIDVSDETKSKISEAVKSKLMYLLKKELAGE